MKEIFLFFNVIFFNCASGQSNVNVINIPFGKWEKVAIFDYNPVRDSLFTGNGLFSIKGGMSYYNFFKKTRGWKKETFVINTDTILEECTLGRKNRQCRHYKLVQEKHFLYVERDTFEILYHSNDVLVLYYDMNFFDLYFSKKRSQWPKLLPNDFMLSIIRHKFEQRRN